MRKSILQTKVEDYEKCGYTLYSLVDGVPSTRPRSNTGKAAHELRTRNPDFFIIIVVGAKRRYKTQGNKCAVMYKSQPKSAGLGITLAY